MAVSRKKYKPLIAFMFIGQVFCLFFSSQFFSIFFHAVGSSSEKAKANFASHAHFSLIITAEQLCILIVRCTRECGARATVTLKTCDKNNTHVNGVRVVGENGIT